MKIPKAKKLPSGAWHCRVRVNGRDISITRDTKKDAIAAALDAKLSRRTEPLAMTLGAAYDGYIAAKAGVLSPSTIAGYMRLRKNTMQGIMQTPLRSLTNEQIQREISAMAKTLSPKYIANAGGLLSSVLKMYHPDFNLRVTLPQKRRAEQRALTDDELSMILKAAAGTKMELPILMGLWLGMRMSEIVGAQYRDIRDGYLHIWRAVVLDANGRPVEKPPKTMRGDRWVRLPAAITRLLEDRHDDAPLVPMSGQAIYKGFVRLCDKAGVPPCRFHDLRHANAAAMIRLGIDSKYAQERNGWASDYMYKQVYGYTMPDKMEAVADAIDAYFSGKMATE